MVDQQALYKELGNDFDRMIGPLFEFGEQQIRKRGQFLPYGATLFQSGEIGFQAGTSGEEFESTIEVLPVLHEALRARVKEGGIAAAPVFTSWNQRSSSNGCGPNTPAARVNCSRW